MPNDVRMSTPMFSSRLTSGAPLTSQGPRRLDERAERGGANGDVLKQDAAACLSTCVEGEQVRESGVVE